MRSARMLRRLQAARQLGGLAAVLPRAVVPLDALHTVNGAAPWRAAAAQEVLRSEGGGFSAATRALGATRRFCAAAGGGVEPAEPPVHAAAPPERESAVARGEAKGSANLAPDASAARAPTRAKRVPNAGAYGEKTASGRPKPDVRTVARLVELGWWSTAEAAEAMLTRTKTDSRFAFDTAGPVIDWLLTVLGDEKLSSGRCLAANAIQLHPLLLALRVGTLQQGWELVTLAREAGGLGLSEEVAGRRVAGFPHVLVFSKEHVQKRAAILQALGVPDGYAVLAREFRLLGFSENTLRSKAMWLRSHGLDLNRILSTNPAPLVSSVQALSPRLDFMLNVVCLDVRQIPSRFLVAGMDSMRPRFFYALQRGASHYAFSTLVQCSDAKYLKMIHCLEKPASVSAIAAYKAHTTSPAFRAYMDEQEHAIRARRPHVTPVAP